MNQSIASRIVLSMLVTAGIAACSDVGAEQIGQTESPIATQDQALTKAVGVPTVARSARAPAALLNSAPKVEPDVTPADVGAPVQLIEPTETELKNDYVTTPSGQFHKSCVYAVDSGASVGKHPACSYKAILSNRAKAASSKVTAPTVNGWVEASYQYAPSPGWFSYSGAGWYVPSNPNSPSALIYYFPGFENTSGSLSIIQPVLQWGNNGGFGGNYWTIASWFVDNNGTVNYSTPVTVSAGQIIDGTMSGTSCTTAGVCTWTITTAVRNTGASTVLTVRPGYVYNLAFPFALEAYGLTACNQYPANGAAAAYNYLYLGTSYTYDTATWSPWVIGGTPSCNYSVTISPNPGATYLYSY
jgi:hypothetical protein